MKERKKKFRRSRNYRKFYVISYSLKYIAYVRTRTRSTAIDTPAPAVDDAQPSPSKKKE